MKHKNVTQNYQPQYEKYIKCHVYRIHPRTFGYHGCGDLQRPGGPGECNTQDQSGHGCMGPGDPGMPGHGTSFTYAEVVVDQPDCMDFEAICSPFDYGFDMMNGNKKFDHGEITTATPKCNRGSDRGPNSICYSPGNPNDYNPNYNYG